mmetsp:Transcript_31373/g.46843  ORF Transcript_31373/g.46843 Transcript_31373/m.46843 type:complete len:244 (-) Transcript_31373:678-1409(-)
MPCKKIRINNILKKIQYAKKPVEDTVEELSLFELLNLQTSLEEGKKQYNDEAVLSAMHNDPEAITKKYDFQEFKQSYPIIPALCLGASYEVVDMMINTFPEAVQGEGDILHTVCSGDYDVNAEALGRLIECCPDAVQKQNCKGNTALHIACESGAAFGVVKVLITKHTKALVMKNNRAETPLHLACIRDAPLNVIQLLLSKSPSSLWIQNCNGRTPLMCAEHWNASEDVVMLLKKWSRPSAKN